MLNPSHTNQPIWASPKRIAKSVSGGITEASPIAPTDHAEPAECPREPARPKARDAHQQNPQAAEDLAVGAAEAIRDRLDHLPHGHRLGRVRRVEGHDRAHAGIEHEAARDEQHRPDQPDRGRGLHQGRSRRLQALVQGQRQDGQGDSEDHVGDEVHDLHGAVVGRERGDLGGRVHRAL